MDRCEGRLRAIFARTDGKCHICHRQLSFCNYNKFGERGAWEIEHSTPKCMGGTDRLNNLYAAHMSCNRRKGAASTRCARAANGFTRAPLSTAKKEKVRSDNRWGWGAGGAGIGALLFGPPGALIGGIVGTCIGDSIDPES